MQVILTKVEMDSGRPLSVIERYIQGKILINRLKVCLSVGGDFGGLKYVKYLLFVQFIIQQKYQC
jgi:hypothetical protein